MMGGMEDPQVQQAYLMMMMQQNPALAQNPQYAQMYLQQAIQQQQQQQQMAMQQASPAQSQTMSSMGGCGASGYGGGGSLYSGAASKAGAPSAPSSLQPAAASHSSNHYASQGGGGPQSSLSNTGPPPPEPAGKQPDYHNSGSLSPAAAEFGTPMAPGASGRTVEDDIIKVMDPQGNQIEIRPLQTFSECPFPASLQDEVARAGFTKPSQIQAWSWPIALQGNDVVGVAATGSGKTIAFLFPAFMHILNNRCSDRMPVLLVLAPTRELAVQIEKEAQKFGANSNIKCVCCYGGAPKGDQLRLVRSGCHCLIATPGRLNDFLEGKQIRLDGICKLVLDEADRMLDMGFEPQIRKILREVPTRRHTMFFTATWPKEVRKLAEDFLHNPYQVQIGNRDELKGNQDITQMVKVCQQYEKNGQLIRALQEHHLMGGNITQGAKGLVFSATKRGCDQLERQLRQSGVASAAIHGDKDQRQRDEALENFRSGRVQVLVATDVAARGLDIKGVTLVVNFDPANNAEDYVHRIGRTGRAGQKGTAITFLTNSEANKAKGIIEVMEKTQQHIGDDLRRLAASVPDRGGKGDGKSRFRDRSRSPGKGKFGKGKGKDNGFERRPRSRSPPRRRSRSRSGGRGGRRSRSRSRSRGRRPRSDSRRRSPSRRRKSPPGGEKRINGGGEGENGASNGYSNGYPPMQGHPQMGYSGYGQSI